MPARKRNLKSEPAKGSLHKELIHIPAKRGSVSGRQHPDITAVRIMWVPENSNIISILRSWDFEDDYETARDHYNNLRLS